MSLAFPVLAAALWVGAAALVILLPRVWRRGGSPETNEDWLRLRQSELAAEPEALKEEAALRLIEDGVESESQAVFAVPQYSGGGQALAAAGKGLPENLGDDIAEIREATNRVLRELRGE